MSDEDNHIDVETPPEQFSDRPFAERLAVIQDRIGAYPPEKVAFASAVLVLKGDAIELDVPEGHPDQGSKSHGFATTVVNEDLDGFTDTHDVLASAVMFNDQLEDAQLTLERPDQPEGGLAGLLSGLSD